MLDPELHSFSYDLDNEDELVEFVGQITGVDRARVETFLAEVHADHELTDGLRRRVRWRFDLKRRMPVGNRLLWYALVRATRPALVVETGIYQGLGSLVVLRALARNAEEGADGRLVSFDLDPASGELVPDHQAGRWTRVIGDIEERLPEVLAGTQVDVFIHESDHNAPLQQVEFGAALKNAAAQLYVVDSSGDELPVLAGLCEAYGAERPVFHERPRRHFYRPPGTAVAVFRRSRLGRSKRTAASPAVPAGAPAD